jgi:adenosine deaminase
MTLHDFITRIPKTELHLHIEGTFEPELMFEIASRNKKKIPYKSVEEVRKAYEFSNLQDFLDIYYAGAGVLLHEQDFFDLTMAYMRKAKDDNIVHTEIFFDPQTHTARGVSFGTAVTGIRKALTEARETLGITSCLIMCFLRHLDEKSALKTLAEAIPYKEWITGVGLDSSEVGNPPSKFTRVFSEARKAGFLTVAHAGEEGDAGYVKEAIELLGIDRIDHGNRSLEDDSLIRFIVENKIPLTVCPLSNLRLQVVKNAENHPLKKMLDLGMMATVNSDDPAYFGGYLNQNYIVMAEALKLTKDEIVTLVKNSFTASFLNEEEKKRYCTEIDNFAADSR